MNELTDLAIKELCAIEQWATGPQQRLDTSVEQAYAHLGHAIDRNTGNEPVFTYVRTKDVLVDDSCGFIHVWGLDTYAGDLAHMLLTNNLRNNRNMQF